MKRHTFVGSQTVLPSLRWAEAFPQGLTCGRDGIAAADPATDILWLSVAHADWRNILADAVERRPARPVVVLSASPETEEALAALEAGARGYCHAYSVPGLFREIAQVVDMGGLWIGPELVSRFVGAVRRHLPDSVDVLPDTLSAREAEVARAVAAGLSNKEVAAQLGITERTVKAHLGSAFEKLGVRDRLQLVLRLTGRVESDFAE